MCFEFKRKLQTFFFVCVRLTRCRNCFQFSRRRLHLFKCQFSRDLLSHRKAKSHRNDSQLSLSVFFLCSRFGKLITFDGISSVFIPVCKRWRPLENLPINRAYSQIIILGLGKLKALAIHRNVWVAASGFTCWIIQYSLTVNLWYEEVRNLLEIRKLGCTNIFIFQNVGLHPQFCSNMERSLTTMTLIVKFN